MKDSAWIRGLIGQSTTLTPEAVAHGNSVADKLDIMDDIEALCRQCKISPEQLAAIVVAHDSRPRTAARTAIAEASGLIESVYVQLAGPEHNVKRGELKKAQYWLAQAVAPKG